MRNVDRNDEVEIRAAEKQCMLHKILICDLDDKQTYITKYTIRFVMPIVKK